MSFTFRSHNRKLFVPYESEEQKSFQLKETNSKSFLSKFRPSLLIKVRFQGRLSFYSHLHIYIHSGITKQYWLTLIVVHSISQLYNPSIIFIQDPVERHLRIKILLLPKLEFNIQAIHLICNCRALNLWAISYHLGHT